MGEITVSVPNEIPRLKDLDALLRCGICYEYMKTCMMTTCSHNYCSLCIRKSLIYRAQCPTCFEEASDNQLRNNRIVDDIIQIFGRILDEVKSFMQESGNISEHPNKINKTSDFLQKSDSSLNCNGGNKGIVNNVCSNQTDNGAFRKLSELAFGPQTSFSTPKSKVELSDCNDLVRLQNVTPVKESHLSPDHSRKVPEGKVLIPPMFSPRNKHVAEKVFPCPVCDVEIPEKNINMHLDACLKRSESFDQFTSPTKGQKRKHLPKLVYNLLTDKQLRGKLKEHGLSTHGDRKALISRLQRFTLLYNAESDNHNPRSAADIIKQVEREEKEEKKLNSAATSTNKLKIDMKTDPKLIEQAHHQYIQNNKASFEKLTQSILNREAEKKTAAKRKLILSDQDSDSEDGKKEAQVEKGCDLYKPCGSVSSIIENISDDISGETMDMNYEAVSPVLGKNIVVNCSRKECEERCNGQLTDSLTAGMFGKRMRGSGTKKYKVAAQQSKDIETDEESDAGSSQSFSILSQQMQEDVNTASEIDEALSRRGSPKRLNSQHDDSDLESHFEDASVCFETRMTTVKRRTRRTNARLSPQPSLSREGGLRKRAKY